MLGISLIRAQAEAIELPIKRAASNAGAEAEAASQQLSAALPELIAKLRHAFAKV